MRKKLYIAGLGLAFLAGGLIFGQVGGNLLSANPGGAEDPLVSRSYVDMRFNELVQLINAQQFAAPQVNTEAILNEILADIERFFGGDAAFSPVHVYAGQIILAGEGTEIILRSGTATAHVPGPDGIVNATAGQDIFQGAQIPANNLMIIPREDGRGIRATTNAWFIIRGDFRIAAQ